MAPLLSPSLILAFSVSLLLISPALSLTCTSQNFTNNLTYSNCTDLPSLGSYLHWTLNSANNSLSIAFAAASAKPSGWIAWGINPTGTKMIGTQSLLAFKHPNGSMTVNTYNISSYTIAPSKISFDVSGLHAEDSGDLMKIFATLALPANTTEIYQVWQVGGSVTGGRPEAHSMQPANMNSKGSLTLVKAQSTNSSSENGGTSMMSKESNGVFYVCLLILGIFSLF